MNRQTEITDSQDETIMALLDKLLKKTIRHGSLTVIDPKGYPTAYGDGSAPHIAVRIHTTQAALKILFDPQMAVGEAYMEGTLTVETGTIYDVVDLVFRNIGLTPLKYPLSGVTERLRTTFRRLAQFNPAGRSRKNVAHHYDLSDTLYDLFLDADRQYSCAYVMDPSDTIETAQAQKKRHLAAKLLLKPGQSILDIGSGWGGLGLYLAETGSGSVTGLTLSTEQLKVSQKRVAAAGLSDRVRFKLQDYRAEKGLYDRIISVGMFEHVGITHYDDYFKMVARCLKEDGVALIHAIGRPDGPGHTNPWITKYIFPGGYCPSLSEVIPAIERAGLIITDIEILRLHYAETLRLWRERFEQNRAKIRALYDERFCRMWEFYLITSELSFRHQGQMVFQIQLAKRGDAVPITRDYITAFEQAHPLAPIVAPVTDYSRAA
jgi:cyclopropane-fatty-acyl-phospholipid synthase